MLKHALLSEVLTFLHKPWPVEDILQELVPHLPNLHFSPLGPHPVLLPLQSPQLQTHPCSFPVQGQVAPGFLGASCKIWLFSRGFCSTSLAWAEVKAWWGRKYAAAVTLWEAEGVVALGVFQPQGSQCAQTTQSTHATAPREGDGLPLCPSLTRLPCAQMIYLHWTNCLHAKSVTWTNSLLLPEAMKNTRRLVGNFRSSSSFHKLEIKFPLISAEESSHLIQLVQ